MFLSAASGAESFLSAIGLISKEQESALFGMLRLLLPPDTPLPTTIEALHAVTQKFLTRPREMGGSFNPGLRENGWVVEITGPKGERSGCGDSPALEAHRDVMRGYAKIFGFYDPLVVSQGVDLKGVRVLSTGAMYERVCLRMECTRALVSRGLIQNKQIYFSGSAGRKLFDAEQQTLAKVPEFSGETEADMVQYVAKKHGFLEQNFLSAVARINTVRADTEAEGKALGAGAPVLVVSNAPFARRQALDVLKALLQDTKQVPVVIAMGDGCTPKTPIFTMIEELTYWIHSAKTILDWTKEHCPGLSKQVSMAITDIMNIGKPGYAFQSDAYKAAFPEGAPVAEQVVIPTDVSVWRYLGGELALPEAPSVS